jgi:Domain of unknown function (DUF4157)
VHDVLSERGQPLDAETRAFMEPRFGHDFSHVRVHNDTKAVESARTVNALAYTVGHSVVLGHGGHVSAARHHRSLLGHELAHVVQQTHGGPPLNRENEAEAEAAARALTGGAAVELRTRSQIGLARQPSSGASATQSEEDLYKAMIEMPQVEKDQVRAHFSAAGFHSVSEPEPKATPPAADVGCHIDPHKASPGQAACPSHHQTPDEATRVSTKILQQPLDVSGSERRQRAKLDRLNTAYLQFRATKKYIHRNEFSPYEIEKDNIIATSDRWDAWMNARGIGINNLEAVEFDERYFRSKGEFEREWSRREEEYKEKRRACYKKHSGLKAPKLSRTRPDYYGCYERLDAEYRPMMAAARDASLRWAHHEYEVAMPVLVEGGPVAGAGFTFTHEVLGWSTERAAAAGGLAGGVANVAGGVAMKVGAQTQSGGGAFNQPAKPPAAVYGEPPEPINITETQPNVKPPVVTQPPARPEVITPVKPTATPNPEYRAGPIKTVEDYVKSGKEITYGPKVPAPDPNITAAPKHDAPLPEGYGDLGEQTGISTRTTPGGRQEKVPTAIGKWTDKNAELLQNDPTVLKRLAAEAGTSKIFNKTLPNPEELIPEYKVPHPDYPAQEKPRIDRLWRRGKTIIEIKPNTKSALRGEPQARQYAEWMNDHDPLPNGEKWKWEVYEYDQAAMETFLRAIGVLKGRKLVSPSGDITPIGKP